MSVAMKVLATVMAISAWALVSVVLLWVRAPRDERPSSQHWWGSE